MVALLIERVRAEVMAALPAANPRSRSTKAPSVSSPDLHRLSERELEVLRRVASGHTSNAIAEQLGISARTVETYRSRIQKKLGRKLNVAEMTRWAIEHGLV